MRRLLNNIAMLLQSRIIISAYIYMCGVCTYVTELYSRLAVHTQCVNINYFMRFFYMDLLKPNEK